MQIYQCLRNGAIRAHQGLINEIYYEQKPLSLRRSKNRPKIFFFIRINQI